MKFTTKIKIKAKWIFNSNRSSRNDYNPPQKSVPKGRSHKAGGFSASNQIGDFGVYSIVNTGNTRSSWLAKGMNEKEIFDV